MNGNDNGVETQKRDIFNETLARYLSGEGRYSEAIGAMSKDSTYMERVDELAHARAISSSVESSKIADLGLGNVSAYLEASIFALHGFENPRYSDALKCIDRAIESSEEIIFGYDVMEETPNSILNDESGSGKSLASSTLDFFSNPSEVPESLQKFVTFSITAKDMKKELERRLEEDSSFKEIISPVHTLYQRAKKEGILEVTSQGDR